jgi:hypothetical protein
LRLLVETHGQTAIRRLKGKVHWEWRPQPVASRAIEE